jgi:hypothetical protein
MVTIQSIGWCLIWTHWKKEKSRDEDLGERFIFYNIYIYIHINIQYIYIYIYIYNIYIYMYIYMYTWVGGLKYISMFHPSLAGWLDRTRIRFDFPCRVTWCWIIIWWYDILERYNRLWCYSIMYIYVCMCIYIYSNFIYIQNYSTVAISIPGPFGFYEPSLQAYSKYFKDQEVPLVKSRWGVRVKIIPTAPLV